MTASNGLEVTTPGSEFVDLIAYYSTEGTSKSTQEAPILTRMQADKYESSAPSTDSEHAGTRSSGSSLGDSATAAARVLAAWQDRAGESPGTDSSVLWPGGKPGGLSEPKVHSSTSTPRMSRPVFDAGTREGSAPVAGSADSGQRRADMSFLALLNSAAAYVAESSNETESAKQQQPVTGSYSARGEMFSNAPLPHINGEFDQGRAASGEDTNSGFHHHYGGPFQEAQVYPDFAQVFQHMSSTGSEGGLAAAAAAAAAVAAASSGEQAPYDTPGYAGSSSNQLTSAVSATETAVRPEQLMGRDKTMRFNTSSQMAAPAAPSKRKRKDTGQSTLSPAKRKTSHGSDRSKSGELRRAARKWSDEETDNLLRGCSKYGVGAWKKILDDPEFEFNNRTSVDLKDRFRTIRAQECAHSPYAKSSRKGGGSSSKEPDVVWPLPPNSQRLQGLQRVQRKPTRNYTSDEDRRLLIGVLRHANHWTKIAADPELELGERPGQSLRDRLRNAFPEVFELFGYVIPKKERADRERGATPGSGLDQQGGAAAAIKRKAPTGSKRLEGEIPDNIREKIMGVLQRMNASLDPHPIPDSNADQGSESKGELSTAELGSAGTPQDTASTASSSRRASAATSADTQRSSSRGRGRRRASTRQTRAAKNEQEQEQPKESALFSAFPRPMSGVPAAARDQLDALALEGCVGSGQATPVQAPKRRHSVQADIDDALEAAALAAGIDRTNIASALQFLQPGIDQLGAGAGAMPLSSADTMRRMTVAGPMGDPFIFPRLPEEGAAGHMRSDAGSSAHSAGLLSSTETTAVPQAGDVFKLSAGPDSAKLMAGPDGSISAGMHRGQLRSAERLLRANGVADDNRIGLSTAPIGGSRVDLEALAQFSQWFPSFNWGVAGSHANDSTVDGSGGHASAGGNSTGGPMVSASIDPNMLNSGLDLSNEYAHTHARRRSQLDWYGLTPSLVAALDVAGSTTAAIGAHASASTSTSGLAMTAFGLGHAQASQPAACRRPSMPIFPSFSFQGTDMLHVPGAMPSEDAPLTTAEPASYASGSDNNSIAAAAAAAAAAVAVALSNGNETLGIQATDCGSGSIGAGLRSYSIGAGPQLSPAPAAVSTGRPRVASAQHGRRRTMHVPPSLAEDVACAEFDTVQPAQTQRGRRAFPYPPRPYAAPVPAASSAAGARARRSRSISSNQARTPAAQPQPSLGLPAISTTPSGVLQTRFPSLPVTAEAGEPQEPASASEASGVRHTRTFSGTQLSQDALSALATMSPSLLSAGFSGGSSSSNGHFGLAASFATAPPTAVDTQNAAHGSNGHVGIDLEAMTSLSTSHMELSFKPSLWTGADDASMEVADETRSLADVHSSLHMVDLYRASSSTPTGSRYLDVLNSGSARNASPTLASSSNRAASPLAPRSAASTPGRREAVGI
ncbi:hypothetical protein EV183_000568 [Coemansia sp. RSA 2336]|nr:hypothetical protein EV183_000568 [Coemansia sp. RSA 2336]